MNVYHKWMAVCVVMMVAVAGASAQDVKTDYDHHADFSQYHTYSWHKVHTDDPLWQSRVTDAVDHALQAKGLQRVDDNGDLSVAAIGASHNQREYETFYNGFGPGWRWGGFGPAATTRAYNYQVGTLVLDLYDTKNKQLVWRGMARDTLSDKPEKNEKKLHKALEKMLKDFPPKDKG